MNARHHTQLVLLVAAILVISGGAGTLFAQSVPSGSLKALAQPKVLMTTAIETAVRAHPGVNVLGASLDNENGYLVYSVKLENGLDVKVDAGNGSILSADHWNTNDGVSSEYVGDGERRDGESGAHGETHN